MKKLLPVQFKDHIAASKRATSKIYSEFSI